MNWLECKIALLKMSYWSEILDEMEGRGIPPPSTRMGSTGNHVLENSLPKINAKNFFIDFFILS